MNQDFDNELLSAFLDGELSGEEADVVRRQLEQSEALQTELSDLKNVGGVVRNLPTESAPADLMSSVMNALPARSSVAASVAKPRVKRNRWYGLGAMLVGAAALMLMLRMSTGPMPTRELAETAKNAPGSSLNEQLAETAPMAKLDRAMPEAEAATAAADIEADAAGAGFAPTAPAAAMAIAGRARSVKKSETVQVIRITGDERKSGDLLQKFLTAQMLDHQQQQRSIEGQTLTTFVVNVDASEVATMLRKAEQFEDGELVVRREKPKSILHQQLLASIELHKTNEASVMDSVIASNSARPEMRSRSIPAPPSPAPAAAPKARRKVSTPDQSKSIASGGFGGGGYPGKAKASMTTLPTTSPKKEVQVIFVLKPPTDESSEACDTPAA